MFGLLLVAVLPLHAQTPQEPWALTLDERIALRTNPDIAVTDFNGQTHPELFLPTEVFRSLIQLAFPGSPRSGQLLRNGLMPEVKRLDLPPDFWERLRSVSTIYIADSFTEPDLREDELALKQRDVCRSRATALADARREFGQERFDRFLYEGIAVSKFRSDDRLPTLELLRHIEEGCPSN
ncbi:MAG TPA: hypothetical protein VGQ76_28720 [Thermoanaerobaculia bacterium]|nr:hypothetical protein [Thermoanaerobaculia bacterium]